ncbi:MAG: hypothetical protein HY822_05480 [Acidobacteria bacterium]|nr:hypothetical protein [Acidobacteriota bacterium]
MSLARLNLLTACGCLAGSAVWVWMGSAPRALVWVLLSLAWVGVAVYALARRGDEHEEAPFARLGRRLYRLLSWFS